MYIGVYKPMVMYFGLTNSPATFQTIMNNLFWNMINQRNIATFIDNIIIATETEEEYNKVVKEILKQLEENDLFVKPEKCKWKVQEMEFLGSGNRTKRDGNAKGKGGGCTRVADTKKCKRSPKVPRTG